MDVAEALKTASIKVTQKVTEQNPDIEWGENDPMDEGIIKGLSPFMAGFFDLQPLTVTNKIDEQAKEVEEWVELEAQKYSMDRVEVMKSILFRLGQHSRDIPSLERVHRYVKIRRSVDQLHEQERAMTV